MVAWRIYYGNGTTAEGDTEAQWIAAPSRNVQVVVAVDELPLSDPRSIGRAVFHSSSYYLWLLGGTVPVAADLVGVLDNLVERGLATLDSKLSDFTLRQLGTWGVKIGRTIATVDYDRLLLAAANDPGFPRKSATRAGESFIDSLPRV